MRPILMLTKNLVAEQRLQEHLQYLNYEVFCSVRIFNDLIQNEKVKAKINKFQILILSDTISDSEVIQILSKLVLTDQIIFRKSISEPSNSQKERWKKLGIEESLSDNDPIDQLREKISKKIVSRINTEISLPLVVNEDEEDWIQKPKDFVKSLSKKEKLVFHYLLEANGRIVSRKELCQYLWESEPTNSCLSQLSVIVKRILIKMEEDECDEYSIRTLWGQGYRLTPREVVYPI